MKKIRRKYLVDRPLQFGYAANMILLQLVVAAVTAAVTVWIGLFVLNDRLTGQLDTGFFVKLAVILVFMAIGVLIWAVRSSHAIAGPIFKTQRLLRAAAAGNPPHQPVAFRRHDAFKELATDLGRLFLAMRCRQQRLDVLSRDLGTLKQIAANDELPPEDRLARIAALLAEANRTVHFSPTCRENEVFKRASSGW